MKILALPNAHALAHVSRLLEIAKVLRTRKHEVIFAGCGKYLDVAAQTGFETRALPYVPVAQIVEAVRSNRLWRLFPEKTMEACIYAETELIAEIGPDLLLLDNRPSARTSAELAGVGTVAVLNAHMCNWRTIPFGCRRSRAEPLPGLAWTERLGVALENRLYDRLVMGGLNRIRRRYGLRKLFAYEHEEGDSSLLADIPDFNPTRDLPPSIGYVGPLTWRNSLPAPACLEKLNPARPTVYLSLGSESLDGLVGSLGALTEEGLQLVVAVGGGQIENGMPLPDGMFLEPFVNAERLLPRCDLVCCHGGNGTLYQALAQGLPVVAVATHGEQYCGARRIRQLGLGQAMTLKHLQRHGLESLARAIRETLGGEYRARAKEFSKKLKGLRSAERAAFAVEKQGGSRRADLAPLAETLPVVAGMPNPANS